MSSKVGGIARAPVWGANLSYYYYDDFIHSQSRKRKLERRHEVQHRDPYDPRVKHQSMKIKEYPEQNFDKLHERKIQLYQLRYSHLVFLI